MTENFILKISLLLQYKLPLLKLNHPKDFFSLLPSILVDKNPPINIPVMAIDVRINKNCQSILKRPKSPVKPYQRI